MEVRVLLRQIGLAAVLVAASFILAPDSAAECVGCEYYEDLALCVYAPDSPWEECQPRRDCFFRYNPYLDAWFYLCRETCEMDGFCIYPS